MEILDLLGNQNRLKILRELAQQPKYITELSEILDVRRKAILDHIKTLKEKGLIEEFKTKGRRKYYKISNDFVFKLILSEHNSMIYHENLKLNKETENQIKNEFKDLNNIEKKLKDSKNFRENFSLIRDIETELQKLHKVERYLSSKLDKLIEETTTEINKKTDNELEKRILLEILRNGQISPEELSKKLKINRNKVFDTITNLRKKNLI